MPQPQDRPAPVPAEGRLDGFLGYRLRRTYLIIHDDLRRVLDPFGLRTTSFSALMQVLDNPGLNQSRLAEALAMERSNLVVVVDELEQAGLIARSRDETDRRAYALHPTPLGRRTGDRAAAAVAAHEDRLLRRLSPQERIQMIDMLRRIEA